MLKARAGTDSIAAALVLRSWSEPSFTLAAAACWDFQHDFPRLGVTVTAENYGDLRCGAGSRAQLPSTQIDYLASHPKPVP